jgi:hypothetical protein
MVRIALVGILVGALAAPAAAQSTAPAATPRPESDAAGLKRHAPAAGEVRHSGRILEVARDGSALVLEEIVAWTGPGTGAVRRSIRLTPRTSIRVVERTDQWDGRNNALPGWDAKAIAARDLRPGDFVTVTTDDDQRATAVALQIVRPAAP